MDRYLSPQALLEELAIEFDGPHVVALGGGHGLAKTLRAALSYAGRLLVLLVQLHFLLVLLFQLHLLLVLLVQLHFLLVLLFQLHSLLVLLFQLHFLLVLLDSASFPCWFYSFNFIFCLFYSSSFISCWFYSFNFISCFFYSFNFISCLFYLIQLPFPAGSTLSTSFPCLPCNMALHFSRHLVYIPDTDRPERVLLIIIEPRRADNSTTSARP